MPRGTFCAPRRIGIQFLCHKLWPPAPCSGSAGTGTLYVLFYDTYSPFLRPAGGRFGGRRCSPAPPRAGRNQRAARARYAPRARAARRAPGAPGWCGARRPGGGAADATSEPGCGMSRQCPQTRGGGRPPGADIAGGVDIGIRPGGWPEASAVPGGGAAGGRERTGTGPRVGSRRSARGSAGPGPTGPTPTRPSPEESGGVRAPSGGPASPSTGAARRDG